MHRSRSLATAALLTLGLSACGPVYFSDNFDSDPLNQPPRESPAGAPEGDLVSLVRDAAIVVQGDDGPGDRHLLYLKQPDLPQSRYLALVGRELPEAADRFTAVWDGRFSPSAGEGPLEIFLGDAHYGAIAVVRLDGDQVFLVSEGVPGGSRRIGSLQSGVVHTVLWTVDRAAMTHSLSIVPRRGRDVRLAGEPVLGRAREYLRTTRPSLYFWFPEGRSGRSLYALDNVVIAATDERDR